MPKDKEPTGPFGVGELIELNHLRIKRNGGKRCTCVKGGFLIDVQKNQIECGTCGVVLDPIQAFITLGEQEEAANHIYKARYEQSVEMDKYRPKLKWIQHFEDMYMKQQALPKCPHCNEPFSLSHIKNWGPYKWCKKRAEDLLKEKVKF